MAKNMGWIKLHRSIVNSWIYDEKFDHTHAWIDLLMDVNHEDKKIMVGSKPVIIKAGQKWTSYGTLATRWGWNRKTVKSFLETLQGDGMVTLHATPQGTLITIVNYSIYQFSEASEDNRLDNQTDNRLDNQTDNRLDTNKNDKELKNDKKIYNDIMNTFNQTCISLPKIKTLGARREEALDELISTYSLEEIQQIFIKAQASPFLRGDTGNGWKATFDWLIKPDNASKVLSDTYVAYEKKSESGQPKNAFHNFTERNNDYEQLERLLLEHNKREVNNMISRRYE